MPPCAPASSSILFNALQYAVHGMQTSSIKCTKEMLSAFSKEMLKGEGGVLKHFAAAGYVPAYTQSKLDEFVWRVTNLAVDLRDGARLTRMVERLAGVPSLSLCKQV